MASRTCCERDRFQTCIREFTFSTTWPSSVFRNLHHCSLLQQKSALESKSKDNSTNSSGWRGPNGEVHKPWSSKSGVSFTPNCLHFVQHNSLSTSYHSKFQSRHTTSSDRERSMSHTDEKMPEWLDEGPVSHTDVIELKGFDEDMVAKSRFQIQRKFLILPI